MSITTAFSPCPLSSLSTYKSSSMKKLFTLRGEVYIGDSFEELSHKYAELRDASKEGISTFPPAVIIEDLIEIARLSYNGCVWAMKEWDVGDIPLYAPNPFGK